MSTFWSWWVIILFVGTVIGVCWVLIANRKIVLRDDQKEGDGAPKTGHVYDGIEEYDNPLPAWWFKMFIGSAVFALVYVVLYPGLGNFPGVLKWTAIDQLEKCSSQASSGLA